MRLSKKEFLQKIKRIHKITLGTEEVCIAVIDGKVDYQHPCLKSTQIEEISTMNANQGVTRHGTHVTSIIFSNQNCGLQGIAPKCRGIIVPIFYEKPDGSLQTSNQLDLARAINYVINHKEQNGGKYIINISAGEFSQDAEPHPTLQNAIKKCQEKDILIVSATGNNGCACIHIPAAHPNVLAVGALSDKGIPMDFSNWGGAYQNNGLTAPGENILGALANTEELTKGSGTSFATPLISGTVALLLSLYPQYTALQIKEILLETATPCQSMSDEGLNYCDHLLKGSLNIPAALQKIKEIQTKNLSLGLTEQKAIESPYMVQSINNFKMNDEKQEVVPSEAREALTEKSQPQKTTTAQVKEVTIEPQDAELPAPKANTVHTTLVQPPLIKPSEVEPSNCGCNKSQQQLVYALGSLGVDFGTDAILDSFKFYMMGIKDKEGNDIE